MVLSKPERALRYALIGTGASLVGGLVGYAIGYGIASGLTTAFTFDPHFAIKFHLGSWAVDTTVAQVLTQNFWLLAIACSVLPTPYKVVAIGSGFVGVSLPAFLLASLFGRTVRFFVFTYALVFFGARAQRYLPGAQS
jgi:membrane protein YqaA with SNARE-associated domain